MLVKKGRFSFLIAVAIIASLLVSSVAFANPDPGVVENPHANNQNHHNDNHHHHHRHDNVNNDNNKDFGKILLGILIFKAITGQGSDNGSGNPGVEQNPNR